MPKVNMPASWFAMRLFTLPKKRHLHKRANAFLLVASMVRGYSEIQAPFLLELVTAAVRNFMPSTPSSTPGWS